MMPVNKRTLLIFACIISLLHACKKDGDGGGLPLPGLSFPMEVGYKWTYQINYTFNGEARAPEYCYWEIVRADTAKGKQVKVLRQIYVKNNDRDTCYEYLYQDATGLYVIATEGDAGKIYFKTDQPVAGFFSTLAKTGGKSYPAQPLHLLKYPVDTSESWASYEFGTMANTTRGYNVQENVYVPAGIFSARRLVISLPDGRRVNQHYTAHKGLVKESETIVLNEGTGQEGTITSEVLLAYTNF